MQKGIKFFLFANHLTLFSITSDITRVVCCVDVTYENGAKIKTSFLSNAFGDIRVMGVPELHEEIKAIHREKEKVKHLPTYDYPPEVLTVYRISCLVSKGIACAFREKDLHYISALDSQKIHKKAIFGNGFLLSEQAALRMKEAERQAEIKAAEAEAAGRKEARIVWTLSEREKEIIKR
jgi:ribosomal protein L29